MTTQSQTQEVQKARHRKDIKERPSLLWFGVPAAAVVALLLMLLVR